jgi:DNA (cytosine-5)-methyltransferase 1
MKALDLFAGPGGWDIGARQLGIDPLGIEVDGSVVKTRMAAGLRTLEADVAIVDPPGEAFINGDLDLLLASPPCQPWSAAGKREAERDRENVYKLAEFFVTGRGGGPPVDWADPRSRLAAEPMRWIMALRPKLVSFEQVPPVLGLWEWCADLLRRQGYSTWTGLLSAEQYGIPQTRERAFLMAIDREDGQWEVIPPAPTHQRYIPPMKARQDETLFDPPEAQRIVHPEDRDLLPWISMAEALGWGMTERPYPVVASGRSTGGPDKEKVGGAHAREAIYAEKEAGRWKVVDTGCTRSGQQPDGGRSRDGDEPAPPLTSRADQLERRLYNRRDQSGKGGDVRMIPASDPAPTISGESRNDTWVHERPATTVAGDPRIPQPGHKKDAEFPDAPRRMEESVRVELHEAAVLQGFPADYPFHGSKTKQFEQVGNALPPGFAAAVLGALLGEIPGGITSGASIETLRSPDIEPDSAKAA